MKKNILLLLFLGFMMPFAASAQTIQKTTPAGIEFKYFKDTIIVGYANEVRIVNAGSAAVQVVLNGCSVRPGDGSNVFNVLAPANLAGQEAEIIVSSSVNGVNKVLVRKKVKFVASTPQLLNRMQ
ncbi:MAG TPA: hypothetical protein DEP18_00220 [Flavobacteriales bacterium]|nr:hypothetical protein [Flavobacteriales bacterium]HRE75543.1 hypothetical protein [Flavobacteriales bacterium]HRE98656.1 hypothetical protein [Flavobacteriales bacterium]HRJ36610.1 hypothetical protein [Flavobacteriales bacterium]HRJ40067.1 hypothetical protein [Flavobacteriales bacterium]